VPEGTEEGVRVRDCLIGHRFGNELKLFGNCQKCGAKNCQGRGHQFPFEIVFVF
jgi:hypothetical protein